MSTQNIVCFFGADSKVGVSMISQSMAEAVSDKFPDKKILLINLSGYPGNNYSCMTFQFSLDDIRIHLQSNVLTEEELINVCAKKDNLYILKGTKLLKERRRFSPEHIERLLLIAKEAFDLVIINGGCQADSGISLGAVLHSDIKILVSTQQHGTYLSYQLMEDIFYELSVKFDLLLINKYLYSVSRFISSESDMKTYYGISDMAILPMSEFGWQAEKEAITLTNFGEKDFKQGVSNLINEILNKIGEPDYQANQEKSRKRGITKLFGGGLKR